MGCVFNDVLTAAKGSKVVTDNDMNEWIRLEKKTVSDGAEGASARVNPFNASSTPAPEDDWVCVKDADGELLSNGPFKVSPDRVKLWRGLYLRWHPRNVVAHPIVRCLL